MQSLLRQIAWFVIVGCAAAATHWIVVVALVKYAGLRPPIANIGGWLVAFVVSFSGHFHLTFRHVGAAWLHAAWRFLLVSVLGFAMNETAYTWLLHATTMRYDVLLAAVLIGMAFVTFIASRLWAFRRKPAA
jgi:putative flippase GtrA